jgi:CAAX prenyl protease-like protein
MAVALTTGLFAVEHSLWVAGLMAGLAYAGLYMTTNNLRAPVLAHAVTNAILGLWILTTGSWHLW